MEPNNQCLMGMCADSRVDHVWRCLGKRELMSAAGPGPCLFGLQVLPSHVLVGSLFCLASVVVDPVHSLDVMPSYLRVPYFLTLLSIRVTAVFKKDCL